MITMGKGELKVQERRVDWEILDAWRDAAEESGIPKIPEFNRGDNFGNAYFQMNQNKGVRMECQKSLSRSGKRQKNLTILTEAPVEKLILKRENSEIKCKGVEVKTRKGIEAFWPKKKSY